MGRASGEPKKAKKWHFLYVMDLRNKIFNWSEILNIASKSSFLGPLPELKWYMHYSKSCEWIFEKILKIDVFLAPRLLHIGP